ncbi:deoxycytidyl transferase [Coemansia sp. RSA 1843]|nr:deoxycytidyl transferase [Coemansia sp. RSA 1843]
MSGTHSQGVNAQQAGIKAYSFGPEDTKHIPINRISDREDDEHNKGRAVSLNPGANAPGFGDFHTYFHQRKRKLAEQAEKQAAHGPQHSQVFAGVVFHINGYTQPSHYELKRLLLARGGRFLHYLSKTEVTHIIASNLTMSKEKEFRNYKVVRPEWVLHSISAGKQLPWHRYGTIRRPNSNMTILPADVGIAVGDLCAFDADADTTSRASSSHGQCQASAQVTTFVVDRFGEGLNREWVRRNLATESDFIQRYYANSRLHHLSMWKAELKDYVAQLRQKRNKAKPKTLDVSNNNTPRVIMHVDFDCFFVSASLLSYPHLKDRPVAVCHSHKQLEDFDSSLSVNPFGKTAGTSQIASCNYTARSFGVKNGMFMDQAVKLCPSLMVVPYVFEDYKRISRIFYKTVAQLADETQAVSVDEALLDVTHAIRQDQYQGNPRLLAQDIRSQVLEATKCVVSIGIGPSILLARIATTSAKPDGVFALDCETFITMDDIAVNRLPGVGYAVEENLSRNGINSIFDIREASLERLKSICGEKTALTLYNYSHGIDRRVLESDQLRQAFGADIGWGVRFSNQNEAENFVSRMAHEVCGSMAAASRTGGSVTLKIKRRQEGQGKPGKFLGHGICDNLSRSASIPQMTNDPSRIAPLCIRLLHQMSVDPLDIRGVGIQVQRLNTNDGAADIGELLTRPNQNASEVNTKNEQYLSELLPSASQIDVNILKELPESIRSELLAAYKGKGTDIGAVFTGKPPLPDRDLVRRPPATRGGKRGRPRKLLLASESNKTAGRPKKSLLDAFSKVKSLDNVMPSQIDSAVWNSLPTSIRRELAREYVKSKPKPKPKPGITKGSSKDGGKHGLASNANGDCSPLKVPHKVPMLLGKHELSDVRRLVRGWIDSSSVNGPLDEDVAKFGDYIESLIKHRDLLKARDILTFWKVCASKRNRALWSVAIKQVLDQTNGACMAMYGAMLHI